MRFHGSILLSLVLAASGGSAAAEAVPVLTLDDAIAIALADNPDLGAAAATARAAAATADEAAAARAPRVELSETFSRTTNPVFVFGNLLGQEAFGPDNFDPAFLNEPDALSNWNSTLSVRVPVYVGGRIAGGVEAARAASDAADGDRERARHAVRYAVVEAYTGVLLADANLVVAREAAEVARRHADLTRDLREVGLVVESDVLQAEVRVTEVEEMVARAEAASAVVRAGLNAVLGRDLDTPLRTVPFPEDEEDVRGPLERSVAEGLDRRPDLMAAGDRVRAARGAARAERGGLLPEVGVEGRYEANAEDFVGADGTNWSVFAAARWTVFEGRATTARVRRAQAEAEAAERARDALADRIGVEIRRAWHEIGAAGRRFDAATRAVALAEDGLRIVRDRYREGMTTLVELLDAENALTRARVRAVAARRDVRLARAALDLATGQPVARTDRADGSER